MKGEYKIALIGLVLLLAGFGLFLINENRTEDTEVTSQEPAPASVPSGLADNFSTDFSNASTDFTDIVQGVSSFNPKDVIPALTDPELVPLSETAFADDVRGILIEVDGESRYYPYNVLVWHEIVNDHFGDTPVTVTFCPLCGSAIAFNPVVDGEQLEFGVSGFLRESNMVMYDRTTESLWQQSTGISFAGDFNETQLELLPLQLLSVDEVRAIDPDTLTLSTNTGHSRDYTLNPYGDYDEDDSRFLFTPSNVDSSYPSKELFYIVRTDGGTVALRANVLEDKETLVLEDGTTLSAEEVDGLIEIQDENGNVLPGYYEMWFSWAVWNSENGTVWDPSEQ